MEERWVWILLSLVGGGDVVGRMSEPLAHAKGGEEGLGG